MEEDIKASMERWRYENEASEQFQNVKYKWDHLTRDASVHADPPITVFWEVRKFGTNWMTERHGDQENPSNDVVSRIVDNIRKHHSILKNMLKPAMFEDESLNTLDPQWPESTLHRYFYTNFDITITADQDGFELVFFGIPKEIAEHGAPHLSIQCALLVSIRYRKVFLLLSMTMLFAFMNVEAHLRNKSVLVRFPYNRSYKFISDVNSFLNHV